jgi:hypothetical protein
MSAAEFITLRHACGLTQSEAAGLLGVSKRSVEVWEGGQLAVKKAAGDRLKNLDDLIRAQATLILAPLARRKHPGERVNLIRYRTPESYAAAQRGHATAGLSTAAYHAMLCRVIDGLARLDVRYAITWADQDAESTNDGIGTTSP